MAVFQDPIHLQMAMLDRACGGNRGELMLRKEHTNTEGWRGSKYRKPTAYKDSRKDSLYRKSTGPLPEPISAEEEDKILMDATLKAMEPAPRKLQSLPDFLAEEDALGNISEGQISFLQSIASGHNCFLTGGAGVGKSYIINLAVKYFRQRMVRVHVVAPTGTAARLIQGSTLHAFMGIPQKLPNLESFIMQIKKQAFLPRAKRWLNTEVLIIDEISMVSIEVLEFFDKVARRVRKNKEHLPAGGIQIIAVGDFFQLPPVTPRKAAVDPDPDPDESARASMTFLPAPAPSAADGNAEEVAEEQAKRVRAKAAKDKKESKTRAVRLNLLHLRMYLANRNRMENVVLAPGGQEEAVAKQEKRFCFESSVWPRMFKPEHCVEMQKVFRQTDQEFIRALNEVRVGLVSPETEALLLSRVMKSNVWGPNDPRGPTPIRLTTHRYQADAHNQTMMARLATPEVKLRAKCKDMNQQLCTNQISNRRLLSACPVPETLTLKVSARVMLCVNLDTALGLVNGACGEVLEIDEANNCVAVKFEGIDGTVTLKQYQWKDDLHEDSVWHIPLLPAWAITIHKAQGASLNRAIINCSKAFEHGQVYTAISRVKSIDGLYIDGGWNSKVIVADERVLRFYASF